MDESRQNLNVYRGADTTILVQVEDDAGSNMQFAEGRLEAKIKRFPFGEVMASFEVAYSAEEQAIVMHLSAEESMNIKFSKNSMQEKLIYDLLHYIDDKVEMLCFGDVLVQAGVTYERQ